MILLIAILCFNTSKSISIHSLSTQLTFIWLPDHSEIARHDLVNSTAKQAINFPNITYPTQLRLSDLKIFYSNHINFSWTSTWSDQLSNKLYQMKQDIEPCSSPNRDSCREEIVLDRRRIGHTRFTLLPFFNSYVFFPICDLDYQSDSQSVTYSSALSYKSPTPPLKHCTVFLFSSLFLHNTSVIQTYIPSLNYTHHLP